MSNTELRLGLVGAGAIAQAYAQALGDYQGARLTGVADIRVQATKAIAEGAGARVFDSYTALAEKGDCNAVIVCTPPASHPQICKHFLAQGVHVLCEKPLAIDVASAESMLAVAEKNAVILTMCSKFRYVEDVINAKSIVTSGILGELILFENTFASRVDMTKR